jgi:membrane protease YdiL (CAAX protease family)
LKEVSIEKEVITSLRVSSILYLFIVLMVVPIVITTIVFVLVTGTSPMAGSLEELSNNVEQVLLFNIVLALFTIPILWSAHNRDRSLFIIGEVQRGDFSKFIMLAIAISISYSVICSYLEIEENLILRAFDSSIASMLLSFITVCLLAPVIEELVYRGVLFSL